MTAFGWHLVDVDRLVPQPWCLVHAREVDELLCGARGSDVEELHRLDRGRIFIIIRDHEKPGELRRLSQELQSLAKGLSGDQHERFDRSRVRACEPDRIVDTEHSCSAKPDNTWRDATL